MTARRQTAPLRSNTMGQRRFTDDLIEDLVLRDELHRLGDRTDDAPLSRIATALFQAGALATWRSGDRARVWSLIDGIA